MGRGGRKRKGQMTTHAHATGAAQPFLPDAHEALAVVRHMGAVQYRLSDRENWILDWTRWRDEFVAAGYAVPARVGTAGQRGGIEIVDEHQAARFLAAPDVRRVDPARLRSELVTRFPGAQSWWDVDTLFPIAFVDFDRRRFAAFYPEGPRLERYVPAGWTGEFVDFANSYPPDVFPDAAKFWVVDGHDLLQALIERGRHGDTALPEPPCRPPS